jgi:hypothetical protein
MLPTLPPRLCLCGCKRMFTPRRSDTRYATETCRTRAYRQRHKPSWFDLLNLAQQEAWTWLRQSNDPAEVRAALVVELEGRANGHTAAARALTQLLWTFGLQESDWSAEPLKDLYPEGLVNEITAGQVFEVRSTNHEMKDDYNE